MKNKRLLVLLAMTVVFAGSMSACSFGGGGEEEVVVTPTPEPEPEPTATPEPTPTIAPDVQDTTYTTADQSLSIELPDATWSNTTDEAGVTSFESPDQGLIRILYGQGDDMSTFVVPTTQDTASALEAGNGMTAGTDFEISDFQANDVSGVGVYTYTVKYLNTTLSEGYTYAYKKVIANDQEYYDITAFVTPDDANLLATEKAAVDSIQILSDSTLKAAAGGAAAGTEGTAGGTTDGTTDGQSSGAISDEALSDTNQTRTIYTNDGAGTPIVLRNDGNGNWTDDAGNSYNFTDDTTAYDQNGVDYYYHGEAADVAYMPVNTEESYE